MSNPFGLPQQQPTAPVIQAAPQPQQVQTFGNRIVDPVDQPTRVVLFPVILSFPHLFTPKPAQDAGKDPMYQVELWIYEDDPAYQANLAALNYAVGAAAQAEWGAKIPQFTNPPYRALEQKDPAPEHRGFFLNAKSKAKPSVVYNSAPPGTPPVFSPVTDTERVYPGVICAVAINAYAYKPTPQRPQLGKGVGFALNSVVLLKDGPRIASAGGPKPPEQEFAGVLTQLPFGELGGVSATVAAMPQMPGFAPQQFQQPQQFPQPYPQAAQQPWNPYAQ